MRFVELNCDPDGPFNWLYHPVCFVAMYVICVTVHICLMSFHAVHLSSSELKYVAFILVELTVCLNKWHLMFQQSSLLCCTTDPV